MTAEAVMDHCGHFKATCVYMQVPSAKNESTIKKNTA